MKTAKKQKHKRLYFLLIGVLAVVLVSSVILLLHYWENGQGFFPVQDEDDPSVIVSGTRYVPDENIQSILILGLDKFENDLNDSGYKNDQQSDFLMLLVLDNENKTYSAIHLNRDTMANINVLGVAGQKIDTFFGQLALAHAYGNGREVSCRNTVDAVSDVLSGVKIDRYISVTMDAVPVITDLVGGVEVEIKDDFTGVDDSLRIGESVVLTGEQALTFVRTRQGLEDSSNSPRMIRQQDYLVSLINAFNKKMSEDESFPMKASLELSDYIVSNYSVNQLENLMTSLSGFEFEEIYELEGKSQVGEKYMEFYVDEEAAQKLVLDLFYVAE